MSRTETWVEVAAYSNPVRGLQADPMLSGRLGAERKSEKLVEGRWLVRWWRRIR